MHGVNCCFSKRQHMMSVGAMSRSGGWAHVASTLREDFPSGTMQGAAAPDYAEPPAQKGSFGAAALQPPTAPVTAKSLHAAHALPGVPAAVAASQLSSSFPAPELVQRQADGQAGSAPSLQAVGPPAGASMAPPAAAVQAPSGGNIRPAWTAAPAPSGGSLQSAPVQMSGTGPGNPAAGADQPGGVGEGMHCPAANKFEGSGLGLVSDGQPAGSLPAGAFTGTPAAGVVQPVVPELQRTPP